MILRPFLSNCVWDVYSHLGGGLPGRKSIETSAQTEVSTADTETQMEILQSEMETQTELSTANISTQTDQKVFASIRASNSNSLSEEKTKAVVGKLLKVSRVTHRLQTAEALDQFEKLVRLKILSASLQKEAWPVLPNPLKTAIEQVAKEAQKVIRKIELRHEGPFAALEERVKKLEDFSSSSKSYGQWEFLWIQMMIQPDCLKTEDQCAQEWKCKLYAIYNHQAELRKQYIEAEADLTSIITMEIETSELQPRVSLLFGKIAESFVKTEQEIEALEKKMDAFGKEYPKFQETREAIASKNNKNGQK